MGKPPPREVRSNTDAPAPTTRPTGMQEALSTGGNGRRRSSGQDGELARQLFALLYGFLTRHVHGFVSSVRRTLGNGEGAVSEEPTIRTKTSRVMQDETAPAAL